jgi:hypothetical protein
MTTAEYHELIGRLDILPTARASWHDCLNNHAGHTIDSALAQLREYGLIDAENRPMANPNPEMGRQDGTFEYDDPTINPATGLHYYGSPQWDAYDEYQIMDEEERAYYYR